jgi:hypothetical protein
MRLVDLQHFALAFDSGGLPNPIEEASRLLRETEQRAIESAVKRWSEQAGVTVEKWAENFGFKVSHVYEGTTVTVRVEPVVLGFGAGRPLTQVVFPQPSSEPVR